MRKKDLSWLTCEGLRERYVEKRMSMMAIGKEFNIDGGLVRRRLIECGIEVSIWRDLSWIKCSDLRRMYEGQKMSMKAIAEGLDIQPRLVSRRMTECGIERRSQAEAIALGIKRIEIDPELLRWLYEDMQMSTTEIGVCLGFDQSMISRWLKTCGIEARAVSYWHSHVRKREYKPVRSIRGDLMIVMKEHPRANARGYVKLAVLAYEKHYGEVPEGYVIHFVDGDVGNLSKGNLRAMSNSEHSTFHAFADARANWTGARIRPTPTCPKHLLPAMLKEWDEKEEERRSEKWIIELDAET